MTSFRSRNEQHLPRGSYSRLVNIASNVVILISPLYCTPAVFYWILLNIQRFNEFFLILLVFISAMYIPAFFFGYLTQDWARHAMHFSIGLAIVTSISAFCYSTCSLTLTWTRDQDIPWLLLCSCLIVATTSFCSIVTRTSMQKSGAIHETNEKHGEIVDFSVAMLVITVLWLATIMEWTTVYLVLMLTPMILPASDAYTRASINSTISTKGKQWAREFFARYSKSIYIHETLARSIARFVMMVILYLGLVYLQANLFQVTMKVLNPLMSALVPSSTTQMINGVYAFMFFCASAVQVLLSIYHQVRAFILNRPRIFVASCLVAIIALDIIIFWMAPILLGLGTTGLVIDLVLFTLLNGAMFSVFLEAFSLRNRGPLNAYAITSSQFASIIVVLVIPMLILLPNDPLVLYLGNAIILAITLPFIILEVREERKGRLRHLEYDVPMEYGKTTTGGK